MAGSCKKAIFRFLFLHYHHSDAIFLIGPSGDATLFWGAYGSVVLAIDDKGSVDIFF